MELTVWTYKGSERTEEEQTFTFRLADTGSALKVVVRQVPGQTHHSGGVWDSAVVLSEWAVGQRWAPGSRVLEIGAGTGLTSVVLSRLGCTVRATDLPEALACLRANVAQEAVDVAPLTWGDPVEGLWDVVLLADCVFGEFDLWGLLATLKSCKSPVRLIFGYKPRLVAKETLFFRKLGGTPMVHPTPKSYSSTNVQIIEYTI
jgi:predicted nicotinamide N-methyase